jgi:DNA repair exonuclease SbcCD ATPase subunit
MHGDVLLDLDGLSDLERRVRAVQNTRTRLTTLRDQIDTDLAEREREVQLLVSEIELLSKVGELFKVLLDQLIEKQVRIVEKIATKGLQTVFYDNSLSLEADVDPKYNKIAIEFFIRKGHKDNPSSHRGRPLDSFGGGPSSFISLVLRILAVKKLKLWPVLLLDESLGAVSDEYIDLTGQFIRAFAEKLGFDIILVTHKPAFLDHAHTAYRCTEETEEDGASTYVVLRKAS